MNNDLFFKDCFTEVEGGINAEFNKATVKCFNSTNNAFSMDCDGNLVVNSIMTREGNSQNIDIQTVVDKIYPIGSIYMSVNTTNPSTLFGGTWEQIKDRFLLCSGDKYTNGLQGGEETHQLNINEIPSHNHLVNINTSEGGYHAHNLRRDMGGAEFGISGGGATGNALHGTWTNTNIWPNSIGAAGNGSHIHNVNGYTSANGGNLAHNNMPPYLTVCVWKRVA